MSEKELKDRFKHWMMCFHTLRINSFLTKAQQNSCIKKIVKEINSHGYAVYNNGFYEWTFEKVIEWKKNRPQCSLQTQMQLFSMTMALKLQNFKLTAGVDFIYLLKNFQIASYIFAEACPWHQKTVPRS